MSICGLFPKVQHPACENHTYYACCHWPWIEFGDNLAYPSGGEYKGFRIGIPPAHTPGDQKFTVQVQPRESPLKNAICMFRFEVSPGLSLIRLLKILTGMPHDPKWLREPDLSCWKYCRNLNNNESVGTRTRRS